MAHVADFLTPAELQKISNLQVVARLVVEGFYSGLHRSPHKGFSIEFAQHRAYVPGDEIRRLDWKVFGKTDRYYVREYEEETNLRSTILLDLSGSMAYRGQGALTKHEYATRLAASLAYLMIQQRDSVGLVTFDRKLRRYIPAHTGVSHLRLVLQELQGAQPGGETELGKVFHDLIPRIHRRGLLVIISDCFGDISDLVAALAHFRHARHEVIIFQINDPDELNFSFKQWTRFESLEADLFRLLDPAQIRTAYLENLNRFQSELTNACHRHRIDLAQITTDRPFAEALAQFLTRRLGRP